MTVKCRPISLRSVGQAPSQRPGAAVRVAVPLGGGQVRAVGGQLGGRGRGARVRLAQLPGGREEGAARRVPLLRGAPHGR